MTVPEVAVTVPACAADEAPNKKAVEFASTVPEAVVIAIPAKVLDSDGATEPI
jgi:hypothetical protein